MPKEYDVVSINDLKQIIGLIEVKALFAIRDYYDTRKGYGGVATMTNKLNEMVAAHSAAVVVATTTINGVSESLHVYIDYPALPFTVTTDSAGRPTIEYINGQTDVELSDDYFDFNNITITLNGAYQDGRDIIRFDQKVLSANDTISQFIVNSVLNATYAQLADYIHKRDVIDFYHDYTDVLSAADSSVVHGSGCRSCISSCAMSCGNGCASSCSGRSVCGGCNGRCQGCSGWGVCTPCTGTCGNNCDAHCNGCINSCYGGCSNCSGNCINLYSSL